MPDEIATTLIDRYTTLFQEQTPMRAAWQERADYYLPHKANILRQRLQGQEKRDHLFTGTGTRAGKRLAANLHGSLTSQALPWFAWKDKDDELQKSQEVGKYYEDCTSIGYKAFHGPESNFNSQQHEFYIDLVFFHTAAKLFEIVTEPNGAFKHFAFKTIQVGTYVIDEDNYGMVDTLIRRFDMTLRNAAKKFGEENLPDELKKAFTAKKMDKKYPFLHVALPAADYEKIGGKTGQPQASIFISVEGKARVKEEGYETFPYMVARWDKASGDVYGSGPAADSLPDLKSLNKTRELKLDASGMAIRPPMRVDDDGVVGDIDLTPGGQTVLRPNARFEPIFMGSDIRVAEITEEDLRKEINDNFFHDDLQLPTGKQMTAEEVIQRIEILNRLMGPTLGRLESEDLNPMTMRAWTGLMACNAFPPIPESLRDRKPVPRYEGPLARAQRGVQIEAILKTRTIAERIAAATGSLDVFDNFDDDKEIAIAMEILGYPEGARRPEKKMEARRKDKATAQAMKALPAEAKDLGAGAANFSKAMATVPQNGLVPGPGYAGA